jgi:hypothetical protein
MFRILAAVVTFACALPVPGQAQEPVTLDTFVRAETDGYLVENAPNGIGVFEHRRDPVAIDQQSVIRMNRDTLYSSIVLDLTEPATITLPDTGGRFMSALVIDQDHYVGGVHYAPATITLTQEAIGTRYAVVFLRTFVDPNDPEDIAGAHAAQDAVTVAQADVGVFDLPDWDQEDRIAIRERLNALAPYQGGRPAFGTAEEVDPVAHLVGTAVGWGANPRAAAEYLFGGVAQNDGTTAYELTVSDVPVEGFWSITVYNAEGYMEAPAEQASLNNVTAVTSEDGSVTIRFGGDPAAENHLRIKDGWSYVVRLYRPGPAILDGTWVFPQPVIVE